MIKNTQHLGNGSDHAIYMISTTENMKHVTNTNDHQVVHMQAHLITNRKKVKIATPLPTSNLQNNPPKKHNHTFSNRINRVGPLYRATRTSPGISIRRRHTQVDTVHRLQENSTPTQIFWY